MERVYVGKVVKQDRHGVTLYIPFSDQYVFNLGSQFYPLLFVRSDGRGHAVAWDPWLIESMTLADKGGETPC